MVRSVFMRSRFVMFCSFAMMFGGLLMMMRCLFVMLVDFWYSFLPGRFLRGIKNSELVTAFHFGQAIAASPGSARGARGTWGSAEFPGFGLLVPCDLKRAVEIGFCLRDIVLRSHQRDFAGSGP